MPRPWKGGWQGIFKDGSETEDIGFSTAAAKNAGQVRLPSGLESLINRARLVPAEADLKDETVEIEQVRRKWLERLGLESYGDMDPETLAAMWSEIFENCVKGLTGNAIEFICTVAGSQLMLGNDWGRYDRFHNAVHNYGRFRRARRDLQRLTDFVEEVKRKHPNLAKAPPRPVSAPELWFQITAVPVVTQGKIRCKLVIPDDAVPIDKADDLSRLDRCAVCKHIFWAKRVEFENLLRQVCEYFRVRRYRTLSEEEKADIKAKRSENRAYIASCGKNKHQNST